MEVRLKVEISREEAEERKRQLHEGVDVSNPNKCWVNERLTLFKDGVCRKTLKFQGKPLSISLPRYVYLLENLKTPGDKNVKHTCGNPKCVNPAHLRTVTRKELNTETQAKKLANEPLWKIINKNPNSEVSKLWNKSRHYRRKFRKVWVKKGSPEDMKYLGKLIEKKNLPSVLTEDQVAEIKMFLKEGFTERALGDLYGVTQVAIHYIKIGKSWKHVTPKVFKYEIKKNKPYRHLLHDEVDEVKKLWKAQVPRSTIADMFGVTEVAIWRRTQ